MSGLTAASLGGLGADTFSHYPKEITQQTIADYGDDLGPPPTIYDGSIDTSPAGFDASLTPTDRPVAPRPPIGPTQPTAAEWAAMPALPPRTDLALTQRAVQQVALQNHQASLSPQSQAAAIRNKWRGTRQPAPTRPLPSRSPRPDPDMQELLALRARQGMGAKIAAYGIAAVAVISLAALLIPTKRRTQ